MSFSDSSYIRDETESDTTPFQKIAIALLDMSDGEGDDVTRLAASILKLYKKLGFVVSEGNRDFDDTMDDKVKKLTALAAAQGIKLQEFDQKGNGHIIRGLPKNDKPFSRDDRNAHADKVLKMIKNLAKDVEEIHVKVSDHMYSLYLAYQRALATNDNEALASFAKMKIFSYASANARWFQGWIVKSNVEDGNQEFHDNCVVELQKQKKELNANLSKKQKEVKKLAEKIAQLEGEVNQADEKRQAESEQPGESIAKSLESFAAELQKFAEIKPKIESEMKKRSDQQSELEGAIDFDYKRLFDRASELKATAKKLLGALELVEGVPESVGKTKNEVANLLHELSQDKTNPQTKNAGALKHYVGQIKALAEKLKTPTEKQKELEALKEKSKKTAKEITSLESKIEILDTLDGQDLYSCYTNPGEAEEEVLDNLFSVVGHQEITDFLKGENLGEVYQLDGYHVFGSRPDKDFSSTNTPYLYRLMKTQQDSDVVKIIMALNDIKNGPVFTSKMRKLNKYFGENKEHLDDVNRKLAALFNANDCPKRVKENFQKSGKTAVEFLTDLGNADYFESAEELCRNIKKEIFEVVGNNIEQVRNFLDVGVSSILPQKRLQFPFCDPVLQAFYDDIVNSEEGKSLFTRVMMRVDSSSLAYGNRQYTEDTSGQSKYWVVDMRKTDPAKPDTCVLPGGAIAAYADCYIAQKIATNSFPANSPYRKFMERKVPQFEMMLWLLQHQFDKAKMSCENVRDYFARELEFLREKQPEKMADFLLYLEQNNDDNNQLLEKFKKYRTMLKQEMVSGSFDELQKKFVEKDSYRELAGKNHYAFVMQQARSKSALTPKDYVTAILEAYRRDKNAVVSTLENAGHRLAAYRFFGPSHERKLTKREVAKEIIDGLNNGDTWAKALHKVQEITDKHALSINQDGTFANLVEHLQDRANDELCKEARTRFSSVR